MATDEGYLNKNYGNRVDRVVTFQDGLVQMLEKHASKGRLMYVSGKIHPALAQGRRGD